jgi:hypothetical protein
MLRCTAQRQCAKKGSQLGISEIVIIDVLWGLLSGKYGTGVLYLLPTQNDVTDFSRARFGPMIADNEDLGSRVRNTDATQIKQIGSGNLYLRGARSTGRVQNQKKSATQLKSIAVDRVVFDEFDEMDPSMIDLALERMGHSKVKEETYLSTPTIPGYGIDALYNESDQRVWEIRCQHCGTGTAPDLEFPSCLLEGQDGRVILACRHCKQEIFPRDGRWIAQYPERSKDMVGWWISQLNSNRVDPGSVLRAYNNPPHGNLAEVFNSKLARGYIAAENKLALQDALCCSGDNPMLNQFAGPACAGIDVGRHLHITIGYRKSDKVIEIIYAARVTSFNDLQDICTRFNVKAAVIDLEPEVREVHRWQESAGFQVFAADYVKGVLSGPQWSDNEKTLKVNRTESLDETVHKIKSSMIVFPRRGPEGLEEFFKHLTNIAKVLQEDESGGRTFRWIKTGPDHYAHSLSYCLLASQRIGVAEDNSPGSWTLRRLQRLAEEREQQNYNPLTFGLKVRF